MNPSCDHTPLRHVVDVGCFYDGRYAGVFECADCATKFWVVTQAVGPYPLGRLFSWVPVPDDVAGGLGALFAAFHAAQGARGDEAFDDDDDDHENLLAGPVRELLGDRHPSRWTIGFSAEEPALVGLADLPFDEVIAPFRSIKVAHELAYEDVRRHLVERGVVFREAQATARRS